MVEATILGIEKDEANYEVFNVGLGKAIDVNTVASTLTRAYDSNSKLLYQVIIDWVILEIIMQI